jgi:hypothetical protein
VTKSRGIITPKHRWTDWQDQLMRDFYPHVTAKDMARTIGVSLSAIYNRAGALGLAKSEQFKTGPQSCRLRRGDGVGSETRFQKGQSPWNKGTKGVHKGGEQTQFKPGQLPHNTSEIGSYRLDKDGTLQRKISNDKGNNSKRWRGVHELVWVAENGPVPPKHIVIFRPGCRTSNLEEITIDKVECISLAENMRRNTRHNLPQELADLIALRAALNRKINARTES